MEIVLTFPNQAIEAKAASYLQQQSGLEAIRQVGSNIETQWRTSEDLALFVSRLVTEHVQLQMGSEARNI